MKKMHLPLAAVFAIMQLFMNGCANNLRETDTVSQEDERKVLRVRHELQLTPETIRDSSYHVEIQKFESVETKKFEVRTVKSIATPYQGWREAYEIPGGICLLPVSICSHLLFICSFGILPYDIPKSITNLSFTGMNPVLNWEDEDRTEEFLVSLDRKMLSDTTENIRTPLAQKGIIVRSEKQSRKYITDEFGGFDLHFLAVNSDDTFFPAARKVSFFAEDAPTKELKYVILTRDYLSKLLWARAKINAYRSNPSGKDLYETVIYLEKNGFEHLAYMLEENELKRRESDKKFQDDFMAAAQE